MFASTSPTRRFVLGAVGLVLLASAARAQSARRRRIGFLATGSDVSSLSLLPFRQELRALGYHDEDIEIEVRGAGGHLERLPTIAAELVQLIPEVIVAEGPAVQAAKQATSTIPILMAGVADPVRAGFINSLAHPGGNVTGLSNLARETMGKRLQLLKAVVPAAHRIAILFNPINSGNILQVEAAQQGADTLRIELIAVEARAPGEIDSAFATLMHPAVDALIIPGDTVFLSKISRIVELAAGQKLPAIYQFREYPAAGGLMSYGPDQNYIARQLATYVDKILKGAKPADLPVEQPAKFELVVNLKTARVLGLTIPSEILAGADEVIE